MKRLGRITAAIGLLAILCIVLAGCVAPIRENQEPVANFTAAQEDGTFEITFNGNSSFDSDGSVVSWKWYFGDGEIGNGAIIAHEYVDSGTYPVRLKIRDDGGACGEVTKDVTVTPAPIDPTAGIPFASFFCPQVVQTGSVVCFNARRSSDSDGWITLGYWFFGDGSMEFGPWTEIVWDEHGVMEEVSVMREVEYTYLEPGDYTITLMVMDNDGKKSSTSRTLLVSD